MKTYLADRRWRLVGRDADRWFRFSSDGTFSAGGRGIAEVLELESDGEVSGRWDADTTTLHLTEIRVGGSGDAVSRTVALGWVDGKLNISIGGEQYRRGLD